MTSIDTRTVVTVVFRHLFRYAYTSDEIAELIETVLTEPPLPICEIYVWDRPCRSIRDEDGPAFPADGRLRIACPADQPWAALNYINPGAPDGALVDSYNPHTTEETPPLLFDPEGDLWFPSSASLPLEQVREAITEYCRTGQRPSCVQWQPGQWY
ncbi:Immunity protein Imm1 [Actinopolyspora lacussalsi subsp. righensis]|uniref:Immunity protein Imm1 n=1 Tax=Actinopolyspora righensis TaxID=995060 RepID=A0A1I7C0Q2_9ACTN|nr:Imm1 family immunity protein [Actinopolyspora righensis]SFT93010.1 Immunity protein Imm1 [Actinopolyspora righensis]